ncbi:hypothetical protein GQ53DRAFT_751971 [Thozetella sp. PMI_491]|nr:hypothetical protein GQ53DRAFT_751971 [Thozetella sp. PMI_491]
MGFMRTSSGTMLKQPAPLAPPRGGSYKQLHSGSAQGVQVDAASASIDPSLSKHKLATGKVMGRPTQLKRDGDEPRKQYTAFSSSPPRTTSGVDAAKPDAEEDEPPPSPKRAASSLHQTTVCMPTGLGGGFRRPVGLGRDTIAPIDRLRKPFKPLTINRS